MLRDLTEDDQKAVHSYSSDPEVVQYMDWGPTVESSASSPGSKTDPSTITSCRPIGALKHFSRRE